MGLLGLHLAWLSRVESFNERLLATLLENRRFEKQMKSHRLATAATARSCARKSVAFLQKKPPRSRALKSVALSQMLTPVTAPDCPLASLDSPLLFGQL